MDSSKQNFGDRWASLTIYNYVNYTSEDSRISSKIGSLNYCIALKFDRHISSTAGDV